MVAVAFCIVGRMSPVPATPSFAQHELRDVPAEHGDADESSESAVTQSGGHAGKGPVVIDPQPIRAEHVPGTVLVGIADGVTVDQVNERLAQLDYVATKQVSEDDVMFGFVKLDLAADIAVEDAVAQLEAADFTSAAQPDYVYHLLDDTETDAAALQAATAQGGFATQAAAINDPRQSDQWALDAIHAYEAWDYAKTSNTVTVAVLDTGVNTAHEDLSANIVAPHNALNGSANVTDENGHGTHVSGIVGAVANNGKGVAGVSYNANVMPVKISEDGNASVSDIMAGAKYVASYAADHPELNVRVLNLSFGRAAEYGVAVDSASEEALAALKRAGVLVVCAAGNYANTQNHKKDGRAYEDGKDYAYNCVPCDYDSSIVGVVNVARTTNGETITYDRAKGSNFNMNGQTTKDMSAPGTAILSTTSDGGYDYMEGTSMAAPCVAGVAALVFAVDPSLKPAHVQAILHETATDINAEGPDLETGYGMVNAAAAVQKAGAPELSGTTALGKGATTQFTVTYTLGSPTWTWTSSDESVAIVSQTGMVTGVGAGTAKISAQAGAVSASLDINVYDPTIIGDSVIPIGTATKFSLSESNPDGLWRWTSSDPNVARVINAYTGSVYGNALGTATLTATLVEDASISATFQVSVGTSDVGNATVLGIVDRVYTESAITFDNLVVRMYSQVGNTTLYSTLKEGRDYEVAYADNIEIGTATVTITGKGNYTGRYVGTFRIARYSLADCQERDFSPKNVTYTGEAIEPEVTIRPSEGSPPLQRSTDDGKTGDYTVEYSDNMNAGTATITIKGINEYVGTLTGNFTIAAVNITNDAVVLDEASIVDKVYTGDPVTQDLKLTYNGMTLVEGVDYEVGYTSHVNATEAVTMQVAGLGNYYTTTTEYVWGVFPVSQRDILNVGKTFAILPAALSSIELQPMTSVADGSQKSPTVVVKGVNGTTLAEGVDYTLDVPAGRTDAGLYTYTATGMGNYAGTAEATLTITAPPDSDDGGGNGNGGNGGNGGSGSGGDSGGGSGGNEPDGLAAYAGTARSSGLSDLDSAKWYMRVGEGLGSFPGTSTLYLDYTLKEGLMSGYRDEDGVIRRFGPDDYLNRAQAATILYRLANPNATDTTNPAEYASNESGLPDVESGAYYTAAVNWCVREGVITGYGQPGAYYAFGPTDLVLREQIATMIARYCTAHEDKPAASTDISRFSDYPSISGYAQSGVSYCVACGIMGGYSGTNAFGPKDHTTRCQMSKIIAVTATAL